GASTGGYADQGGTAGELAMRRRFEASRVQAQQQPTGRPVDATTRETPPASPEPAAAATAVEAQEATTQITFRFPQPVSVPAGQTFVAPILDRDVPAQSIALYQADLNPRNPFAAVRLANDGDSGLPPGVLTLYERGESGLTYVGDARMGPVAGGQQ